MRQRDRSAALAVITLLGMLVAIVVVPAPAATAEDSRGSATSLEEVLTQAIESELARAGVPGAIVDVINGGEHWRGSFGVGDLETNLPMATGDHWRVGSNTKTFVATAILLLVEAGTDTVTYGLGIADFDGAWGHNGGMSGYQSFAAYNPAKDMTVVTVTNTGSNPADSLATVIRETLADYPVAPTWSGEIRASTLDARVGDEIRLTWKSANADHVVASGSWSGVKAGTGSETVRLTRPGSMVFRLTATNPHGHTETSVRVRVSKPAVATELSVSNTKARVGDTVRLSWTSTNADSLEASGSWSGIKAHSGSECVQRTKRGPVTSRPTATNGSGTSVSAVRVDVLRAAKRLSVAAPRKAVAGKRVAITVRGLAAGERCKVRVAGKQVATGTANARGIVQIKVPVPRLKKTRNARVVVRGETADRRGLDRIRIVVPR